jgi:peptidoglycan/xylan/chitin deacetylase (PgdA/CDA1 family)
MYKQIQRFNQLKAVVRRSGFHRMVRPWYSGKGSILMFHRVCEPKDRSAIKLNSVLEVTPAHLEKIIRYFLNEGYRFVSLDEVPGALNGKGVEKQKIVVFTFDDGYKDNFLLAYPILKKHHVPFTIYVTTSFPERTAVLWWYLLDELVKKNDHIRIEDDGRKYEFHCPSPGKKEEVFLEIRKLLLTCEAEKQAALIQRVFHEYGIQPNTKTKELAMDWDDIAKLAQDPLVTIGAHTLHHVALSQLGRAEMVEEILGSKTLIESKIGKKVDHFSYPFGGKGEAGPREFRAARDCGFVTATTTRSSNLFSGNRFSLEALPRIWIDGNVEDIRDLDIFISGFMPMLQNRFRRVVAD